MTRQNKGICVTLWLLIIHLVMGVGSFLFEDDIFSVCGSVFFFAWILLCIHAVYRANKKSENDDDDHDEVNNSSPLILMWINVCGSICMIFEAFYVARVLVCVYCAVMSIAIVTMLRDCIQYDKQVEELTRVELESIKKEYESIKNKKG